MKNLLDFPDEILCKIFEYLNPFDAIYSFLNLNHRFNRLLESFKEQIDFTNTSYEQFQYYIQTLLPILNKYRPLTVIKLGNKRTPGQIQLLNEIIQNEDYRHYWKHIDRVLLQSPRLDELIEFVKKYLLSLSNLKVLVIQMDHIDDRNFPKLTDLIINSVFSIRTLIKLSIELPSGLVLSRLSPDIAFDSLVYLNVNLSLITDLLILIQRIPNIENLTVCLSWWTSGDRTFIKMLQEMPSNTTHPSFLPRLRKFRLIINSIITFQYEHLEQILYRILHNQTTLSFSLILRHALALNTESNKLINGQQWQRIFQLYPILIQFELFVRISELMPDEDEFTQLNSFNSEYFQRKNWRFAYWRNFSQKQMILYSIPHKTKEFLEISNNTGTLLQTFPMNYAKSLSIDRIDTAAYPPTFDFLMKNFPFLEELHINTVPFAMTSMDLPSLHTLKILKDSHVYLPSLSRLFPSINTLSLYFNPVDRSPIPE